MKIFENQIVSDADEQLTDIIEEVMRVISIFSEATGIIFAVHGDPTGTLIFVSRAFTELTGISPEDIKRKKLQIYLDMIHHRDLDLLRAAYEKSYELFYRKKSAAGFFFTSNFRIKTAGGDYRQVDSYSVPVLIDEKGYPKIGANILKLSERKGVNRFIVHYPENNLQLYYSGKLKRFVSERKIKLKEIEIQILRLSADGVNERMISRRLDIKQSLVNHYKRNIFHKLFANSMSEAVYTALIARLI